jgi:predicted transposase YdaD
MRRDSIFFHLFKQFPGLLFELMENPPAAGDRYQFQSIEVKETAFRIDGVFLPPDDANPKIVCFAEVQFQRDDELYDRFFAEIALFLRRSPKRYDDWRGILLFGSRSLEPSNRYLHRSMLDGSQVQCVYLDELVQEAPGRSLGLELIRLTLVPAEEAVVLARSLIAEVPQRVSPEASEDAIIDVITTIMVYQLTTRSREEIEAMLGLIQEEPRAFREERERGKAEGRQEEARSLVLRLLTRRLNALPETNRIHIEQLSLVQLEELSEALLDFTTTADLEAWLAKIPRL